MNPNAMAFRIPPVCTDKKKSDIQNQQSLTHTRARARTHARMPLKT